MAGANEAFAVPTHTIIKGKSYELSPMSFSDIGRLTERLQAKVMNQAKELIKDDSLSRENKTLILDRAQIRASKVSMFGAASDDEDDKAADQMMTRMLNDPGFMTYIVWLALNKKHPELSPEDVDGFFNLTEKSLLQEICIDVLKISGFAIEMTDDNKKKKKKKKAAKKKKRKKHLTGVKS